MARLAVWWYPVCYLPRARQEELYRIVFGGKDPLPGAASDRSLKHGSATRKLGSPKHASPRGLRVIGCYWLSLRLVNKQCCRNFFDAQVLQRATRTNSQGSKAVLLRLLKQRPVSPHCRCGCRAVLDRRSAIGSDASRVVESHTDTTLTSSGVSLRSSSAVLLFVAVCVAPLLVLFLAEVYILQYLCSRLLFRCCGAHFGRVGPLQVVGGVAYVGQFFLDQR